MAPMFAVLISAFGMERRIGDSFSSLEIDVLISILSTIRSPSTFASWSLQFSDIITEMPCILPFTNSVFSYRAERPIDATLIRKFSKKKGFVLIANEDGVASDNSDTDDDSNGENGAVEEYEGLLTNLGGGDV